MNPTFLFDLGSYKTCCLLVAPDENAPNTLTVLAHDHRQSQGIKRGAISDINAVTATMQNCITTITNKYPQYFNRKSPTPVIFNVHCPNGYSRIFQATAPLHGQPVSTGDVNKLMNICRHHWGDSADYLLHAYNLGYQVDNTPMGQNPHQAMGDNLTLNLHAVTIAPQTYATLNTLAERCGLSLSYGVHGAIAPATACLNPTDLERGAILLDLGGDTTKIAIYHHNQCLHTDSIPLGGNHISQDIAQILEISPNHATGIKHHYARLAVDSNDNKNTIALTKLDKTQHKISSSHLTDIIRPRVIEMLELVQNRIDTAGFDHIGNVVLTGGTSRLDGLDKMITHALNKDVRTSYATGCITAPPPTMQGNEFSTLYGLAQHLLTPPAEIRNTIVQHRGLGRHLGNKTWNWIRDNW